MKERKMRGLSHPIIFSAMPESSILSFLHKIVYEPSNLTADDVPVVPMDETGYEVFRYNVRHLISTIQARNDVIVDVSDHAITIVDPDIQLTILPLLPAVFRIPIDWYAVYRNCERIGTVTYFSGFDIEPDILGHSLNIGARCSVKLEPGQGGNTDDEQQRPRIELYRLGD